MELTDCEDQDAAELSVVTECDLPHSPEKVWRALTVPELLGAWLMPNNIRPKEGERFTLREDSLAADRIDCEVLEAEPHRRLRYSWRDREARDNALTSVVTFELTRAGDGCTRLRVTHSGMKAAGPIMALQAANTNIAPRLMRAA
jgi:uncharacterized protein YndB with AHSA1/START domain